MNERGYLRLASAAYGVLGCLILPSDLLRGDSGDLDPTFGNGGAATFGIQGSNGNDYGSGVAIQGDGKIVSVGFAYGAQNLAIARHHPDGTLDTSFGTDGTLFNVFGTAQESGNAVAIQSDGKIVVVGGVDVSFVGPAGTEFLVARFNMDGSLDTSFSNDGYDFFNFGTYDRAYAVLIQPNDQKIVVAGEARNSSTDFGLVRYNTDGSRDTNFGSSGSVTTDFGGHSDSPRSLGIQPDGKIVAIGYSSQANNHIAIARYDANGVLDATFGSGGKVTTLLSEECQAYSGHVLSSGKILVAGRLNDGEDNFHLLVRYNADGSLDTSFNGTGFAMGPLGESNASAIQEDGKILVVGSYTGDDGTGDPDIEILRFLSDGTLDPGFGGGGRAVVDLAEDEYASGIAIQADKKIVVVGESYDGSQSDFFLARLLFHDHQPDNIVGGRGNNIHNLSGAGQTRTTLSRKGKTIRTALVIQNDGTEEDSFTLRGKSGSRHFSVNYTSGRNVTAQVVAGRFSTSALEPQRTRAVRVTVQPVRSKLLIRSRNGNRWLRKRWAAALTSTSMTTRAKRDVAKLIVNHR